MKTLNISEIKKIELAILLEFDKFCKKNNLKYYLAGGTLLGAIRHKGFIPWDDDIDVCMPRKDYEKFLATYKCSNGIYEIKSNRYNNIFVPFSKLVNLRTVSKTLYNKGSMDSNIWIDIFPVDGLPSDINLVEKIYNMCSLYRILLLLCNAELGEGRSTFRKYIKYLLKPLAILYGKNRCINNIEKIAKQYKYDDSDWVGIVAWGLYGTGERMQKNEFEKTVEVEFEGYKFPAFSCWDSYLRGLYGDYMTLPPVEKRKTHDITAYLTE